MNAIYAGSFDPFHNGHLDVIQKIQKLGLSPIILIADNPNKTPYLTIEEREKLINQVTGGEVCIVKSSQLNKRGETSLLTVDYAKLFNKSGAILVRGIRSSQDCEFEIQLANCNQFIDPSIDTIFIKSDKANEAISSSFIKSLLPYHRWYTRVNRMVPIQVLNYLIYKELDNVHLQKDLEPYLESHRYYHNLYHIKRMLDKVDDSIPEMSPAVLYHDVIYNVGSKTNESDSYKYCQNKIDWAFRNKNMVEKLIMATVIDHQPVDKYEQAIHDADWSGFEQDYEDFKIDNDRITLEMLTKYDEPNVMKGRKAFLSNVTPWSKQVEYNIKRYLLEIDFKTGVENVAPKE